MNKIIVYLFIVSVIYACTDKGIAHPAQRQIAKTFLKYAAINDSLSIHSMFGPKLKEIGLDRANVNRDIARLHYLLNKYGIPDERQFEIKEYDAKRPEDIDITIPILRNNDVKAATLVIEFVKYHPGKILQFKLDIEGNETYPVDKDNIMEGAK